MFFILSKILGFFFSPISWIFLLIVVAIFWAKWRKKLLISAAVILFLFGNSFLLHEVNLWWEPEVVKDQDLDNYATGVVLGGYAYYSPENDRITFRENGDRLFQGLRLLQDDRIDDLILSGGSGYILYPEMKESLYVGAYLTQIGIDEHRVILESESRNTHENALYTKAILEEKGLFNEPIVLITSAFHMPRAKACFEKVGIKVIPYPTDPSVGERMFSPDHLFLPSSESLSYWNRLIHEWIGYLAYKQTGYI